LRSGYKDAISEGSGGRGEKQSRSRKGMIKQIEIATVIEKGSSMKGEKEKIRGSRAAVHAGELTTP